MCYPRGIMLSRRGFLKVTGRALAAASAAPAIHAGSALAASRPRVAVLRDTSVFAGKGTLDGSVVKALVDRCVTVALGKKNPTAAWKSLFGSGDTVGIKVNCLAGRLLCSSVEVCAAVVEGLRSAGVSPSNIIIWDQITENLRKSGYTISTRGPGVRCYGNDMAGYAREPEIIRSVCSCFTKILSSDCTAIVNIPVLKDHDLAGVSGSMKNFFGAINNPNKYHDDNCDPFIADLNTHPYITRKQRLIIMDATTAVYNGGPSYKKKYAWRFSGLIAGTDPVAIDACAAKIIEDKRAASGLPSLAQSKRPAKHITTAAELGLGVAELSKIDVVAE